MRVLHILSGIDRRQGGVSAAVTGMVAAQSKAGIDVSLFSTFGPGEDNSPADELRAAGVNVTLIGPTAGQFLPKHPKTADTAEALIGRADVVHIHGLWEDVQYRAMAISRMAGRPYLVTPHGMLTGWALRRRALKKKIYLALRLRRQLRRAARLHFATPEEARQSERLGLGPPSLVEPHGLNLAEFTSLPVPGAFRGRYPDIADKPLVVFMGRLHPVKGLDLLIPAFAKIDKNAVLALVGPDNDGYGATVRDMIKRHGVTDRVVLAGMLYDADRIAALADANIFVLPSYLENFGLVALEALAAATPVIVSDQVNFGEHLRGLPFAQIVPCRVDALAAAMSTWLADAPRQRDTGLAARLWAFESFDWTAVAERWKSHYAAIANQTPV